MRYTIITVALNPGEKLAHTVRSVLEQSFSDYEILIKDGGSEDDSLRSLPEDPRIRVVQQPDHSIYDAMNQAVRLARGEYYLFLNCGDYLTDGDVLKRVEKYREENGICGAAILYGNLFLEKQNCLVTSPSAITDFVCYRNIPCHQVCFYHRSLFEERAYDLTYPVRADYEHFLWCKYQKKIPFYYMDFVVATYEGEGFSETESNQKRARLEHKKITGVYIGKKCIFYRIVMILTLQPLRKKMAESKYFARIYQQLKVILSQ